MKNKIIIAVLATIFLGAGFYFWFSQSKTDKSNLPSSQAVLGPGYKGGVKCTHSIKTPDSGEMKGTLYIYNNKLRFDATNIYKDRPPRETHMIDNGEKIYLWGSGMQFPGITGPGGMILDKTEETDIEDSMPINIEELKKNNYQAPGVKCEPWQVDNKKFALPKDITFQDMGDLMKGSSAGSNAGLMGGESCEQSCRIIADENTRQECLKSCLKHEK